MKMKLKCYCYYYCTITATVFPDTTSFPWPYEPFNWSKWDNYRLMNVSVKISN